MILDKLNGMDVDYIGGLALGAVPLISVITMLSNRQDRPIPGFFVRKEVKDHGTMKLVEGLTEDSLKGKRVAILDDVTTTGSSAMIAVRAAQECGAKIILVLSVVDREEGAVEFYAQQGIPFKAMFNASDFLNSA
jgi:orotate phosphoribosyltransferase